MAPPDGVDEKLWSRRLSYQPEPPFLAVIRFGHVINGIPKVLRLILEEYLLIRCILHVRPIWRWLRLALVRSVSPAGEILRLAHVHIDRRNLYSERETADFAN